MSSIEHIQSQLTWFQTPRRPYNFSSRLEKDESSRGTPLPTGSNQPKFHHMSRLILGSHQRTYFRKAEYSTNNPRSSPSQLPCPSLNNCSTFVWDGSRHGPVAVQGHGNNGEAREVLTEDVEKCNGFTGPQVYHPRPLPPASVFQWDPASLKGRI